ncbi:fimbrial protein [Citrobacter portucalensis]|uniref:fimbrial protein n=1 Tax=Citrobacter portucalensis TaxID=1639133 RepID=UPI003BF5ED99
MKSKIIAPALSLLLAGVSAFSYADTPTGKVHFTGLITASTCDLEQGSGEGQNDQTVKLQTVDVADFGTNVGDEAANSTTNFHINLTGCTTQLGSVNLEFSGNNTDATDSTALAVDTGANAATGVGIRIYREGASKAIDFTSDRTDASSDAVALSSISPTTGTGDHAFNYKAVYVRTAASITEGNGNATADYRVAYY